MTRPRNRRWIWFFAAVATLATAGVSLEVWFNLRQQLTPEQLRQARARWAEKGKFVSACLRI